MIIGDLLIETKGLKQVERKGLKEGFKVIHQIKSNNMDQSNKIFQVDQVIFFQVISSEHQGWFFGERSLHPRLGWLKSSGNLKGHLRYLVEENQEIGLESKQHPKENKS